MNEKQEKLKWIRKVTPVLYDIALAGLCAYIGLRCRSWLNLMVPFESGYLIFGLLLVYYVLDLMMVNSVPFTRSRNLVFVISTCTFSVIYCTMALVLVDLAQLIIKIFVHDAGLLETVFLICGFLCLAAVIIAVIAGLIHARKVVGVYDESPCDKLKQDRSIVLLTDLHIGYFVGRKHIHNIVEQVNAMHPDMVLISGDLFNGGGTGECTELSQTARELSQMASSEGTFAVTGNHDPDPSDESFRNFLRDAGIRLLQDEVCRVGGLQLVGRSTKIKPRKSLKELMEAADPDLASVVIDHDPMGISEAAEAGADCILCGHTHTGQVFPLNFFVRFLYKKEELWGMARVEKTTSVVSSGAGIFSMPMRVGSDSEVVCIDLKAAG